MKSQPQSKSPNVSPGNSPAKLEELTEWLTELMATVKVTNPIARKDPETAIAAMAEVTVKFQPGLIESTIDEMKIDPEAVWPTAGEMISLLSEKQRERDQARGQQRRAAQKLSPPEIMRTQAGRLSLKKGYPHQFLMDVMEGRVTPADATSELYIADASARAQQARHRAMFGE